MQCIIRFNDEIIGIISLINLRVENNENIGEIGYWITEKS